MNACTLRIATVSDAAALLNIYRPYVENTAITFEHDVPTLAEFEARINTTLHHYPYIVAEAHGAIVGYTYLSPFRKPAAYAWAAETSIYVQQGAGGKGYGRALYAALEHIAKAQHITNLNACIAYTDVDDPHLTNASMNFHAHMGYELVGTFHRCGWKFERWYDMIWMEKLLGNHEVPPKAVRPVAEIDANVLLHP